MNSGSETSQHRQVLVAQASGIHKDRNDEWDVFFEGQLIFLHVSDEITINVAVDSGIEVGLP